MNNATTQNEQTEHIKFMQEAILLAQQAAAIGEIPVGAVVVHNGRIIGRGQNSRETQQNVAGHAELNALQEACQTLGSWRLDNCDLYVTLEPCLMCAGAIQNARIRTLYYGAPDPKGGACGTKWQALRLPDLNHEVAIVGGLLEAECAGALKEFFRDLRQRDKAAGSRGARRRLAQSGDTSGSECEGGI